MATITPTASSGNTALTYQAASAGGDTVATGTSQRTVLMVRNASGASINVTLTAVNACDQGFLHNVIVACAVGDTEIFIPPNCETSAGNCAVTYSATTSITVAAVNT